LVIGLDANLRVCCVTQDEPKQSMVARRLFRVHLMRDSPAHVNMNVNVNMVTLAETFRVLKRFRAAECANRVQVIVNLLAALNIVIERRASVRKATQAFEASTATGFADGLMAHFSPDTGCAHTLTFDRGAAKSAGFEPTA
jgi:predicted nucleic-acid-binding protein